MRSVSLWTLGLALLCPAPAEEPPAPEEAGGAAGSPRPSYYRVNSDIETIWQRPAAPGGVRGIFFVAHGCMHQGTDFFGDREPDGWLFEACARSNYGSCLGLPEEVRLREAALRRGYLVVAVSGGSGRQSCWHPGDEVRVAAALRHVRQAEGLPADVPVLAMGASSGGAFLGSLASLAPEDGGVQNLRCLVPQIMALQELPARRVPTLFVHMPRDGRTAEAVEAELAELRAAGVRAAEIRVEPRPVTVQLLRRCYAAEGALEVLQALSEQGLLDSRGFLVADPRERSWAHAVEAALGVDPASLEADESCLAEEFNIAWAVHEITSQYAEEQLDFCEGLAVGSGGVSEPVEATEARGKNLHRDAEPSRSGFLAPAATGALGPEWTRDSSKERPAGTEGAGSYNVSVYTPEQQARLGVDKWGKPAAPLHAVPADQAPAGPAPAAPAAPKGTKGAPEGSPPAAGLPDAQVLVFDAGSSGTRVHVYNVYNGEHVPAVDLSVAKAQTKKVRPGLSSFAERGDLDGAQQSLEQLLAFADQLVAPHRRPAAPAVLKATAGLRSLPRAQAEAVLQRIREVLGKTDYLFQDSWAEIIQGKEEAGLAWVAANYLQGTFTNVARGAHSVGVVELGGASAQVSFEIGDVDASVAEEDLFTFKLSSGLEYRVYAHSYLGFGQDAAQRQAQEFVDKEGSQEDPCYPVSYRRAASARTVSGRGDAQRCRSLLRRALLSAEAAPGRYPGELGLRGGFVAIENFFNVPDEQKIPAASSVLQLEQEAGEVCGASAAPDSETAAARVAGHWPEVGKPNACFALSYQVELLRSLGVLPPGVWFQVARNIGGSRVEWALGAALIQTMQRTALVHSERKPFPWPAALVAVLVLGTVTLLLRPLIFGKMGPMQMQVVTSNGPGKHVRPSKLGRVGVSRYSGYDKAAPAE